jgi:hypothetical protein
MATSFRNPGNIFQATAEATIADGVAVIVGTADNSAAVAGADPTAGVLGLAKVDGGGSIASGGTVDIVTTGIYPGVAMESITQGQTVTVGNSAGGLKPAAPSAGANAMCLGTATEDASSGERVSVALNIFIMQGA